MAEAMRPYYFIVNGRKISHVAATRAEKYIITPEAGENTPGILRTYDSELFLQTIREARQNSDYVIAYVHWGTEDSNQIENIQKTMGYEYINAGADIVIGAHAHVLQGIEFYQGKPIIYNLGNFIFNAVTTDTGMLKIHIKNDGVLSYEFLPFIQKDCYTETVEGSEKERILNFMQDISFSVTFDKNGYFYRLNKSIITFRKTPSAVKPAEGVPYFREFLKLLPFSLFAQSTAFCSGFPF